MHRRFFSIILFVVSIVCTDVWAQKSISHISVVGNQLLDKEAVIEKSHLIIGQKLQNEDINQAVKALFDSGYFADVVIDHQQGRVTIKVVENPTINQIVFEGNRAIADKMLMTDMKMRPRMIFKRQQVQRELQRLLIIYRLKGYFAAKITPQIIKQNQNRVDVVFEIEEGDQAKIETINFIGNKGYSSWELSNVISTKESIWWKFWMSDDVYDPDKIEMDRRQLTKFYLNRGYVDFKVLSVKAELVPTYDRFTINFYLEEGQRYEFGKIKIENMLPHIDAEPLEKVLTIKEGQWYGADLVEQNVEALLAEIGHMGHAFVDVVPVPDVDAKNHVLNITFKIQEGPKTFINRINIGGNVRTIDSVIRRELTLAEGDAFNATKLRESDRNLQMLQFFKKVDMEEKPVQGRPDLLDIDVEVQEQSTGDVNFSAGYSSVDGPLGIIRVAERNLFGRGYELSGQIQLAKRNKAFTVDFVNPYFLGRDLAFGAGLFYQKTSSGDVSSYDEKSYGTRFFIGYRLAPHLFQRWSYSISRDIVSAVGKAFPLIEEDAGKFVTSTIGHQISYDKRDNRLVPTRGYVVSLNNELAGFGGNVRFLKNTLSSSVHHTLAENVVLGISGEVAVLSEIGKRIRTADKFTLGGQTLRGFDYGGVGPHAKGGKDNDALGGDVMFVGSAQVNFPLGLPEDLAITGHVFMDVGTLWDTKLKKRISNYNAVNKGNKKPIAAYNEKGLRMGVGAGISWASPMGVIGIDYAYPVMKRKGDVVRQLLFNLGTGRF